jgi:Outer membrane protein beta-barrel domain
MVGMKKLLPRTQVSRLTLSTGFAAATLCFAATANAQPKPCPPGSWFCDGSQAAPAAPAAAPADAPPPLPPPPSGGTVQTNGGVVINQQAGSGDVTIVQGGQAPAAAPAPPPPAPVQVAPTPAAPLPTGRYVLPGQAIPDHEWGLHFNVQGVAFGGRSSASGVGGLGTALRYKMNRSFALEGGVAAYLGGDYNGDARAEVAANANLLWFLNPRSRSQVYLIGGLGVAAAATSARSYATYDTSYSSYYGQSSGYYYRSTSNGNYSYFGGQFGVGLEFRVARHLALNVDLRGFIRSRTDKRGLNDYEFVSSDGRATNTSGGLISTFGLTIYL